MFHIGRTRSERRIGLNKFDWLFWGPVEPRAHLKAQKVKFKFFINLYQHIVCDASHMCAQIAPSALCPATQTNRIAQTASSYRAVHINKVSLFINFAFKLFLIDDRKEPEEHRRSSKSTTTARRASSVRRSREHRWKRNFINDKLSLMAYQVYRASSNIRHQMS